MLLAAVSHYELQWRAEEDGAAGAWHGSSSSARVETARVLLRRLRPGLAYWVRVRSVGYDGSTSEFSESLLAVATAPPPPEAFPVTDNVVHLFFEPVTTAARYELQWRLYEPSGQHAEAGWEGNESSSRLRGTTVKKRNLAVGRCLCARMAGRKGGVLVRATTNEPIATWG